MTDRKELTGGAYYTVGGFEYPVMGPPRTHQERGLRESNLKYGHLFFVDPGGGKTYLSIAEASALYAYDQIDAMVIFAPNDVQKQWVDEQLPQWCAVRWHGIHNKMTPSKIRDYLSRDRSGMAVLAVNYESAFTPKGRELIDRFMQRYPRVFLCVDESQRCKTPWKKTTREVMIRALRAAYRRPLTGTPILKGLEDTWGQYEIAKPGLGWPHEPISLTAGGALNDDGYLGFRTHYTHYTPIPKSREAIITGYRNEGHLRERVAPFVTRIKSDEFMVGPEPDMMKIPTPMDADQARIYREMEETLVTQIDSGAITAQNALVQMGKLLQIAAGFLYEDVEEAMMGRDRPHQVVGRNKVAQTIALLDQLDEHVLVWAPFGAQQTQIMDAVAASPSLRGRSCVIYSGRDSIHRWRASPNGIMIGNQASGLGVGQNLQFCAANIYVSNTFSAGARWQSLKRTDRMGQERQVRVWDMITPGTMETRVEASLRRKQEVSEANIDTLRRIVR